MSDSIFFITTPIYYINSTPHIGHAYTQIAADARARFERSRGRAVYFLTGTDENALKVARAAQEQGCDTQEFTDELSQAFREIWDGLSISYDDYVRTTEPRHRVVVQRVVEKLWQDGHLKIDNYSGWYSVPDETFFRAEETVERDGQHYLANPTEDQYKGALEWVEEQGHFFRLSQFQQSLLDYYAAHPETLQPTARRNEVRSFQEQGLNDTSISRVQDWGIPLPETVPGHENHVVYVWFPDALLNYASAPGYLSDDPERRAFFEQVWPPDVHLMSKDIFTRFHATFWPALLQALNLPLPRQLFAHGFWTVDGRKMSKRDPETIVEPLVFANQIAELAGCDLPIAVDALRFYCLREVTFGFDGDFSRSGCLQRYNSELANGLGNLVNRTLSMLKQYFDSQVPPIGSQTPIEDLGLKSLATQNLPKVEAQYEAMNWSGALSHIWEVVSAANRVIEEQKPWAKWKAGETESVAVLLHELLAACRWCAVTLNPIMPNASARLEDLLLNQINGSNDKAQWLWTSANDWSLLSAGHRCSTPIPLFPRINNTQAFDKPAATEEKIKMSTPENEVAPASESTAPTTDETPNVEAQVLAEEKATIEYDDFAKIDLKVARVISAERIPKADKLLKLIVDLGSEQRQILAGIAQQFEPESLIGKSVVVVVNLAPRKLRGLESQGMILAASTPDGPPLSIITTEVEVPAGSSVK